MARATTKKAAEGAEGAFETIDYDNSGFKRPYAMTCGTLMVYEAEFDGADMIADVMGKVPIREADAGVIDFTADRHVPILKGLWAMLATAAQAGGRKFPSYREWVFKQGAVDFAKVSGVVVGGVLKFFPGLLAVTEEEG